jgi:hypothetical protein|nr:MAG: hypothetical protein KatS3mg041_1292 [Bacteroidota bacterium]
MDRLRVGIAFEGALLYYAEVEHAPSTRRLLRLGLCEFAFPLEPVLLGRPAPSSLRSIQEALESVLERSRATQLTVAVSLRDLPHAFIPMPVEASAQEQTQAAWWELAQLYPGLSADGHRLTLYAHRRAEEPGAVLAVAIPVEWYTLWRRILERLSIRTIRIVPTLVAAEQVWESYPESGSGNVFLLGLHSEYGEMALCLEGTWVAAASYPVGDPANVAYFGLRLLGELGIALSRLERIFWYGSASEVDIDMVREILGRPVERLDPFCGLQYPWDRLPADLPVAVHVLSIGAALKA